MKNKIEATLVLNTFDVAQPFTRTFVPIDGYPHGWMDECGGWVWSLHPPKDGEITVMYRSEEDNITFYFPNTFPPTCKEVKEEASISPEQFMEECGEYQVGLRRFVDDVDDEMYMEDVSSLEDAHYISFYKKDDDGLFMWMCDFSIDQQEEALDYWNFLKDKY